MNDKKNLDKISASPGSLTIPVPEDRFAEFLVGLLGRPQILRNTFGKSFVVKKEDLVSLFFAVEQRVKQQHSASLIQFRVTVWLDDTSSTEMGSIEEFQTYHDMKSSPTVRATLYWAYLIKFPDKELPERQEIEVDFAGSRSEANSIGMHRLERYRYGIGMFEGRVDYTIRHTARTWGNDIDALLTKSILGFVRPRNALKDFVGRHTNALAWVVASIILLAHVFATFLLMKAYAQSGIASLAQRVSETKEPLI